MKTSLFVVDVSSVDCIEGCNSNSPFTWEIKIPLLPAFSVEYLSIKVDAVSALLSGEESIDGNKLIVDSKFELFSSIKSIPVEIHYHGIKDYSALFPNVNDSILRERLGVFYEEAEKNFEQGAWLSFTLMCGAVFEGLLHAKLNPGYTGNTFSDMISYAYRNGIINNKQRDIMNNVRNSRNLVHANKIREPYISRKNAMEIRITLDMLIKDFSL